MINHYLDGIDDDLAVGDVAVAAVDVVTVSLIYAQL